MSENISAVSARVRFARNLSDTPFPGRLADAGDIKARRVVCERVYEAFFGANAGMEKQYDRIDIDDLGRAAAQGLAERHLISPAFASGEKGRGLIVSKSGDLSIMINEEDHLRIQAFAPGGDLAAAYERAAGVERLLRERLDMAYSDRLGFLTACHTNLGTGMRASVMLHLPGVSAAGALRDLVDSAGRLGVTVRGSFGEGSGASAELYQLSNVFTLGVTDAEIIERMTRVISTVSSEERRLAGELLNSGRAAIEDRVWRAYGTLRYARSMDFAEFEKLYSLARLGAELEILPLDAAALDRLSESVTPAVLARSAAQYSDAAARDCRRADLARAAVEAEKQ